jgi:hypothetical protein
MIKKMSFWPVLVLAILVGTSLIVPPLLLKPNTSQYPSSDKPQGPNKTCSICPPASSGPSGPGGRSGPPGRKGQIGPSGPEGPEGREGIIGPSAVVECLPSNPVCQVGSSGATGAQGEKGDRGDRGFQGAPGEGFSGPTGQTGEIGPTGPVGEIGVNGTVGEMGICGCYNISDIVFPDLNVSQGGVQLNGTFDCDPGSMIDLSCLVNGACPNFTMCHLESRNLQINQNLSIGDFGSLVFMGDPSVYTLDTITVYADVLNLESDGTTAVKTRNNGVLLMESLNNTVIHSEGHIQFSSNDLLTMTSAAGLTLNSTTGQMLLDSYGPILIRNASLENDQFIFLNNGGENIIKMSNFSFDHVNLTLDNTRQSVTIYHDLILNGSLISNTSEFLPIGPKLNVGVGKIKCETISGATISLEAQVIRNNLLTIPPAISNLSAGHLHISDNEGVRISGGPLIIEALNTTVSSNLYVDGNIIVGNCVGCTSDLRMKEQVRKIESKNSILNLRPVSYRFKKEYENQDPSLQRGMTYNGFIAQEVEEIMPFAVKKKKDDLYTLDKTQLIANLVLLMQSMYKEILQLKKEMI